jgi:hypothetical protein
VLPFYHVPDCSGLSTLSSAAADRYRGPGTESRGGPCPGPEPGQRDSALPGRVSRSARP